MAKYKFTCKNEVDFLYKCKYAKATDYRLKSGEYRHWFRPDWNLTGPCNIWAVEDDGMLSCYGPSYADAYLKCVKDISYINNTNLGRL